VESGENIIELLMEILSQIALELVRLTPKIFIVLVVIAISFLIIKLLNISLRKLLDFVKLDMMLKEALGINVPFSLENLIIFIADFGVVLIAVYSIVSILLGAEYVIFIREGIYYGAKIISIIAISIVLLAAFNAVISRVKIESRLKSYTFFMILLIITAMLIDVTALSPAIKNALITGLAMGVGAFISVFAVWFFFHEYLDRITAKKEESREKTPEK